jgi:Cellulase (glycosyl hydrolase family 5)
MCVSVRSAACSRGARATEPEMVYVFRMMKPVPYAALACLPLAAILGCSGSPASTGDLSGGHGGNATGGSSGTGFGGGAAGGGGSGAAAGMATAGGSGGEMGGTGSGSGGVAGSGTGGVGGAGVGGAGVGGASGAGQSAGGAGAGGGTSGSGGAATSGALPALHVDGTSIKDPNGKTIVLRGVDVPDIGTLYANGGQNASGITTRIDQVLAAGLAAHVIRLPVYPRTTVNSGFPTYSPVPYPIGTMAPSGMHTALSEADYLSKLLQPAVDYTAQKNMYAIIDYHQIDDATGQSGTDAITFWQYVAPLFANDPHVIFEPFNEPIDTMTAWSDFKATAQSFIDAIRAGAPNNLIIVPSMLWDQRPGDAASSPPSGTNLVYTAHVYPGNWAMGFQQQVATAAALAPVFFSEWGYEQNGADMNLGTSDANWGPDFQTLVDGDGASWSAWVADGSWTPPLFANPMLSSLSPFGTFTASWLQGKATSDWVF